MPAILPIVALAAAAYIGTTTALVIGTIIAVGITLAMSKNMSGVASSANPVSASGYTTNPLELTFSSDAPRRMVYGKARISGVVAYANVAGDGYEYLYMVVVIAAHQIEDITEIYFDGEAGPDVADGYYEYWWHDGTQTEADANLLATFSEWTVSCKLLGCAYAVVKLKYDKTVWQNGRPNVQFDVKGKNDIYDPRTSTSGWTNNAALCIANFMTSSDGLGATASEMDYESVSAAADISEQIIDGMSASLCDGRYTIDGVIELSTKNGDIISQMLAACAGTVVWTEGVYRLYVGAAVTPVTRVLTAEDLRDNPTLQPRTPSDQSFNGVKGTFLDSTNGWVFSDFPPVVGADYVTQDGGVEQYKDIVLNFTTSPLTAQRLATIFLRRARLEKTITMPCKWSCFNYEVWDVVPVSLPQLGWVSKLFQITDWKMTPPTNQDAGGIELTLVEYSDDIYSDDMDLKPIDGGGQIITPDVTQPNPLSVLYATSGASTVDTSGNPRIRFDWPQSSDIYAVGYEIAFGKHPYTPSDSDYVFISGRSTISYTTGTLNPGDVYIGYVRVVNSYEKRSTKTASNTVVARGMGSEYPEALEGLTATIVDDNYIDLSWLTASGSPAKVAIVWAETNDYSNGVLVANIVMPQTTVRLSREPKDGYYFAAYISAAGLVGTPASVYAAGRPVATVLQTLTLSKYEGDLTNAVWYNSNLAVVQSQKLASELDWEIFDLMVPEPYPEVEYWNKNATYVADGVTLRTSGSLGWSRAPSIPGTLPVTKAQAQVAHFASTEYKQGTFTLTEDANVKLGFKVTHSEVAGVKFNGFNATLENL